MDYTRGIEWRRRGDPPINTNTTSPTIKIDNLSNSLSPPPFPTSILNPDAPVQVQISHQVPEEYDNSFPSSSNSRLLKFQNDENLSSISSSSSSSSIMEIPEAPPMNPLKYLGQDVNVVLNCYMIKIGALMLRVLDGNVNEIKVTISNYGSGGFIQIKSTRNEPKPDLKEGYIKKDNDLTKVEDKNLDFIIPLTSALSFKANVETEFKNNNTFFLKVTLEEGHRIRVLLDVSHGKFDPTSDIIQKKYIKFATPSPISRDDVERLLYIFGTDRMTLIDESKSQFYLHGAKIGKKRKRKPAGFPVCFRSKPIRIYDDDPYFVCDSIHFGTYAYQGRNSVYISSKSNCIAITMKESLGTKMVWVNLPIHYGLNEVVYKLARYDEDGQHKLMLYIHLKNHNYAKLFGTELGLDLRKHFKPESLVDTERMFVVLLIRTRDQSEFLDVKHKIMTISTRPCQYVVELPIIDEILKNSKSKLR